MPSIVSPTRNIATGQCGAVASTTLPGGRRWTWSACMYWSLHVSLRAAASTARAATMLHLVDADAPALLGGRDFAAERLREHLVAETDADERLARVVQLRARSSLSAAIQSRSSYTE